MDVLSSWVICMSEGGWLWIRFPKFPIELFNDQFLWRLGSTPGVMLKIDRVMTIQARGCFTRICVEIDLYKPLQPKIIARGYLLNLQYEGLHLIYFNCGRYGYKDANSVEMKADVVDIQSQQKPRDEKTGGDIWWLRWR